MYCGVWCGAMCAVATAPLRLPDNALVRQLNRLVMYDQVTVDTLVVRGVLCLLCVWFDAMLQLCLCFSDGRELHVAHCGPCTGCIVSEDLVELQGHHPRNTAPLIAGLRIRHRTSLAGGVARPHPACCVIVSSGLHVAKGNLSWASGHRVKWSHVSGVLRWHGHTVYSGGMQIPFLPYQSATLSSRGSCSPFLPVYW